MEKSKIIALTMSITLVALILAAGVAFAQTQTPAPTQEPIVSTPSTIQTDDPANCPITDDATHNNANCPLDGTVDASKCANADSEDGIACQEGDHSETNCNGNGDHNAMMNGAGHNSMMNGYADNHNDMMNGYNGNHNDMMNGYGYGMMR